MPSCMTCLTELDDNHPGIVAGKLQALDWAEYVSDHALYGYPVSKTFEIPGIGEAEIVAKKTTYDGASYYGDLPQGTEFETFIVLRVGERYYQKTGAGDSYGDVTWSGIVRPVKPIEKVVTAYA